MDKREITEEERLQMAPWAQKWIDIALKTGPYSAEEVDRSVKAMDGLYQAAGYKPPTRFAFAPSPICGAIAWSIADHFLREEKRFPGKRKSLLKAAANVAKKADMMVSEEDWSVASCNGMKCAREPVKEVLAQCIGVHVSELKSSKKLVCGNLEKAFLKNLNNWNSNRNGGSDTAGQAAFISFSRYVLKLDLDYSKWDHYEQLSKVGHRFMHEEFWILCSRPNFRHIQDNVQHSASGPSCEWPDGRRIYRWRGTDVPREWIEKPESVDVKVALEHKNAELRRCAAEIIGWDKVLKELNAVTIDKHPDPEIGELLEVELYGNKERFLRFLCATGRTFAQCVPPDTKTAYEAQLFFWNVDKYDPELCT